MNMTILTDLTELFSVSETDITISSLLTCTATALVLGIVIAFTFCKGRNKTKSYALTLILIPAIVQMVIMLVNGNIGTGVAVMGAFNLVRFRSAPGSARDICAIFLGMATGLACGTEHLLAAIIFTFIICAADLLYEKLGFGKESGEKHLKITIPESLDYNDVFDDIFEKYTKSSTLEEVKTTNMGSLYKLEYAIVLKNPEDEKKMIDEIRTRNGNLEISCGRAVLKTVEQL